MRLFTTLVALCFAIVSCNQNAPKEISENSNQPYVIDTTNNNFYDNVESYALPLVELEITGEILNPGKVDFTKLTKRNVIVKETQLEGTGKDKFIGAYRYDGYSLFDILNTCVLNKKNIEEYHPIIDLYIEIENNVGEKVIFTWGEIFYPNNLHRIIIASDVARIVPSKTKDLWTLPTNSKLVVGNDLITERNISNPVKITVKSYNKSFPTEKGMNPMYCNEVKIFNNNEQIATLNKTPEGLHNVTFNTIFYGRGRGIHSTSPFVGVILNEVLKPYFEFNKENLQKGLFCAVAKDGYRVVISYSEIFNRNDQQEFLLVETDVNENGGLFRIFPACDFFSDRAVKSLEQIYFTNN
ncbi:MAG: hypothetical protein A2041_10300 [Bacteroidetes bacterium GWA2_31_9b]|nr:MAG: hypothetical protein A2041_10300 [Bacteroidetes bacterium GWA2_31_9b]